MNDLSTRNFGILIAYILPGFVALWGISFVSPVVSFWLSSGLEPSNYAPTIAGFLYASLGSIVMGMTISAFRWALIDRLFAAWGIERPDWDDARLQQNLPAYRTLIEIHYNYYQFYSNMLISVVVVYGAHRYSVGFARFPSASELTLIVVSWVFAAMARDTLKNYYNRASRLLGESREEIGNRSQFFAISKAEMALIAQKRLFSHFDR